MSSIGKCWNVDFCASTEGALKLDPLVCAIWQAQYVAFNKGGCFHMHHLVWHLYFIQFQQKINLTWLCLNCCHLLCLERIVFPLEVRSSKWPAEEVFKAVLIEGNLVHKGQSVIVPTKIHKIIAYEQGFSGTLYVSRVLIERNLVHKGHGTHHHISWVLQYQVMTKTTRYPGTCYKTSVLGLG